MRVTKKLFRFEFDQLTDLCAHCAANPAHCPIAHCEIDLLAAQRSLTGEARDFSVLPNRQRKRKNFDSDFLIRKSCRQTLTLFYSQIRSVVCGRGDLEEWKAFN